MAEKTLSVFIDESGDFGAYDLHAPYYVVAMILHDQEVDISSEIEAMEGRMRNLGYPHHAIHTGPLIRRESVYENDLVEDRKRLFNILYYFSRKLNLKYICAKVRKSECTDVVDNGQIELTRILTSVFSTLYANVEFRKVSPVDYRLFQTADLVCTMELLAEKAENNSFSRSEYEFFGTPRTFRKDFLKGIRTKRL